MNTAIDAVHDTITAMIWAAVAASVMLAPVAAIADTLWSLAATAILLAPVYIGGSILYYAGRVIGRWWRS